jgi:FtsH-binding integral membrane protein
MRRQLIRLLSGAAAVAAALGSAQSASALCIVTLVDDTGLLGLSGDYESFSSQNAGGASASFTVLTALCACSITIDAVTAFHSAPPDGDSNVAFTTTFSMTGATVLGQTLAGLNQPLGLGLTTVTVHATAEKTAGVFPAGAYELELDAQCS